MLMQVVSSRFELGALAAPGEVPGATARVEQQLEFCTSHSEQRGS